MTTPETTAAATVRDLHVQEGEFLLVDKPAGWTSFDVVNRIRHLYHVKKVGHAGTLDPSATGLLIICTASRTKELGTFVGLEKEYEAEMLLGVRTPSFDGETAPVEEKGTAGITPDMVEGVMAEFVGAQTQLPPMWSAAKVGGRRLYAYARRGIEVERAPRNVVISSIEVRDIAIPLVRVTVVCSKGTYIRTLVDDMGQRLGCGAFLRNLRRTRIGPYRVEDAFTLDDLAAQAAARRAGAA